MNANVDNMKLRVKKRMTEKRHRYIVWILLLNQFLIFNYLNAQDGNSYNPPVFNNGRKDLFIYIQRNLNYPPIERGNNVEANVTSKISISKEGKVKSVDIIGNTDAFSKEVSRVLNSMPDWKPAKINGEPIDTSVFQTVYFSIEATRSSTFDTLICEVITYMVPSDYSDPKVKERIKAENYNKGIIKCKKGKKEMDAGNLLRAIELFNQAESYGYKNTVLYYNRAIALIKSGYKRYACNDWKIAADLGDKDALQALSSYCK